AVPSCAIGFPAEAAGSVFELLLAVGVQEWRPQPEWRFLQVASSRSEFRPALMGATSQHRARFPAHTTPAPSVWVLTAWQALEQEWMGKESRRSVVLVVLDGWGNRAERDANAIPWAEAHNWAAT